MSAKIVKEFIVTIEYDNENLIGSGSDQELADNLAECALDGCGFPPGIEITAVPYYADQQ